MATTNVMLVVSIGGLIAFLAIVRLAFGPFSHVPRGLRSASSAQWDHYSEPESPWVPRARAALARLYSPQRSGGGLTGWSWRAVDREPVMTVEVDQGSSDDRRICGSITGTPGTLEVDCSLRTALRLMEGWVTLSPDGGQSMTLRAGDSLVLHPGFSGRWQNETIAHLRFEVALL